MQTHDNPSECRNYKGCGALSQQNTTKRESCTHSLWCMSIMSISSMRKQWEYCSLALSHRYMCLFVLAARVCLSAYKIPFRKGYMGSNLECKNSVYPNFHSNCPNHVGILHMLQWTKYQNKPLKSRSRLGWWRWIDWLFHIFSHRKTTIYPNIAHGMHCHSLLPHYIYPLQKLMVHITEIHVFKFREKYR